MHKFTPKCLTRSAPDHDEWHSAEWHWDERRLVEWHLSDQHLAEWHSAEKACTLLPSAYH